MAESPPAPPARAPDAGADGGEPSGAVMRMDEEEEPPSNAVVLHEDKVYYPSATEVYGEDVETLVQEEDTQPLSQPIVEPEKVRSFAVEEKGLPNTRFDRAFMMQLMQFPEMVRNVAIVGHLHHGKTSLMDMLVEETHQLTLDTDKRLRYTDAHVLERERGLSVKAAPMSFVLPNSREKSFLVNALDTPGHPNFADEVGAALRLVDGVVLVVDVVEGVMCQTEALIRHCVREKMPVVLVLNKLDRLVLELRLPPHEAYFKIRHTLEEVNGVIGTCSGGDPALRLSPERGNVAFASTQTGWCFTCLLYTSPSPRDRG